MTKKVLMACGNYWSSPFQIGSHHLAKAFVENSYQVAFISDPISPFHLMTGASEELKERYNIYRQNGIWENENTIWTYVPGALATPHNKLLLRNSWLQNNWHKLTRPNLLKLVQSNGFSSVDLLYFDSPNQFFWLDLIPHKKSIFRIADMRSGFNKATAASLQLEKNLAQQVDVVVYTAKSLESYINSLHPKRSWFLSNGVNFNHFANPSKNIPAEYQNIKKPIAVYVGAMDVWFDYDQVNYAAQELPEVSFVLIGPDRLARQHLLKLPNIHILGRRGYNELPSYLQHADLGIIPFDVKRHPNLIHHVNPLKLYEYMAAGLPVVSTEWDELKSINSPAFLASGINEFVNAISTVLSQPPDIASLLEFAKNNSWAQRISLIESIMNSIN